MKTSRRAAILAAAIGLAACSDSGTSTTAPTSAAVIERQSDDMALYQIRRFMTNYVAIGTSVSMGWYDDGVFGGSQQHAWTAQLARHMRVPFGVPSIAEPGCKPPLVGSLISYRRSDGGSGGASSVCADNIAGVVLPTQNLAVENATAGEALNATPASASAGRGPVTSRVLPAGLTQVTAMQSLEPSFVSVEFGGNELLPAQVGLLMPGVTYTPIETFRANYGRIIDAVKATGARALLVSIGADLRKFPTIRTGPEIASQRAAFAAYNVRVADDCDASANYIFVRGKVMTAVLTGLTLAQMGLGPYVLSCADAPGTVDYVLTPANIELLNDLAHQMDAEITRHANDNGYATFPLGALYNISKIGVPFDLEQFLKSAEPYGKLISLDGVHPNARGHTVLAGVAQLAILKTYAVASRDD